MGIGKDCISLHFIFIGTKPLRRYGYSHIGCPAILNRKKSILGENLTCTATISLAGTEFL